VEQYVSSPEYVRIIQEPGLSEEQRLQMVEFLKGEQPVLMFTVQGGIFSEGIDYPEKSVIGGIVVGPGLPQVSFETEMLREYYDLTRSQGFEFAYLYPGMSRAIQSAGRVIRSPKHRGIIVLIGEQFTQSPYRDLLPKDWFNSDPQELIVSDWEQAIAEFWSH
jgi:DNA excision repair protein ERCC-2